MSDNLPSKPTNYHMTKRSHELACLKENNQAQLALTAIDAQKEDREKQRQFVKEDNERERVHRISALKWLLLGIAVILAIIAGFLISALYLGHKDVVLDLVKIFGGLITGFVGGWGYGKYKGSQSHKSPE